MAWTPRVVTVNGRSATERRPAGNRAEHQLLRVECWVQGIAHNFPLVPDSSALQSCFVRCSAHSVSCSMIFSIEEAEQVIGSHLIRLPKEPAAKIVREGTGNFLTYSAMAGIIEI